MPLSGEEVYLTDLETEVLAPFIKRKILKDEDIAELLLNLVDKLNGLHKEMK